MYSVEVDDGTLSIQCMMSELHRLQIVATALAVSCIIVSFQKKRVEAKQAMHDNLDMQACPLHLLDMHAGPDRENAGIRFTN